MRRGLRHAEAARVSNTGGVSVSAGSEEETGRGSKEEGPAEERLLPAA